jgi:hypothetical protein
MTAAHLFEVFQVPFVVLTRPVAWEVCGLRIAYGFSVDLQSLGSLSVCSLESAMAYTPSAV